MPDSNKSTIVIASVLKPVDDSRLYEKIGLSLAAAGKYEVHIIGCESAPSALANIHQHPFRAFRRISLGRMLAPWRIFLKALRLKPDILIIATHELLYAGVSIKLLTGCRLIYDVQENYYWNILYTPAFPLLFKPFIALYVRGKETLAARYVDHFFLAEKGYEHELKFHRGRSTVLENKVSLSGAERKAPMPIALKTTINLIFSGTLAETTGVFTAIDLAVKFHVIDERIRLTIVGFSPQKGVAEKIRVLIRPRPFIQLIAGDRPLSHAEIFKHIQKADFGLITYQINPSTMNSIPTKLYEYLGFRLPILLVNHKPWAEFCLPYAAAIVFDPHHFDAAAIYAEMLQRNFYTTDPTGVYWETEEPRLLKVIRDLQPGATGPSRK